MFEKIPGLVMKSEAAGHTGKIESVVGISMGTSGGRSSVDDTVLVYSEKQSRQMPTEVVSFKDGRIQLMTYEAAGGVASGGPVCNIRRRLEVSVGDFLKGRIINATRRPIDGRNIFHTNQYYTVNSSYTNPLDRPSTHDRLEFGIKAVDGLNTIGKGQRIGISTGSGIGKSTLMGMITRNVRTDTDVIALVGECGREVPESIQKDLGEEGMKRSVLVVVTSGQPAILRVGCLLVAITITEYLRNQGFNVLLVMNSLIHYATAQREIGLVIGEPPIARGYIPSVYAKFPKLLEQSSSFNQGSITGAHAVLMEGDDTDEPIVDTARDILGGYIVLSRQFANEGHFPAIDVGASISRLMVEIVDEEHCGISSRFHNTLSLYQKSLDLIPIGAYKKGADAALDEAVSKINKMNTFLQQGIDERFSYEETPGFMGSIVG